MFATYVINLKSSDSRYDRTINELTTAYINKSNIHRFEAVYGASIDRQTNPNISPFCRTYCTDEMIGCALSHIRVSNIFLNTKADYCLVVEDDIKILNHTTFTSDVSELYNKHKDYDIIKLFCQGICTKNGSMFAGSTAAYILTRNGAKRISNMKSTYHIDMQFNQLKVCNMSIISTYDDDQYFFNPIKNIKIFNQKIGFWSNQSICKVWNVKLRFNILLNSILILFLYILLVHYRNFQLKY